MSIFTDINTVWEYRQLLEQAFKTKPYKGGSKDVLKYPLGKRRYSERYFRPRIDMLPEVTQEHMSVEHWFNHYDKPPIEVYYTDNCMLGTFYPDDTFEFNPSHSTYYQGAAGVVSSVLPGWIQCKSQYGGYIFTHRQTRSVVPVFEGLRIRLCDGTPVQNYELQVNFLDKKLTKPYRDRHENMFEVAHAMLKGMGTVAILKELSEMIQGQVAPAFNYKHEDLSKSFTTDDPAGAVMWLALRYNIGNCRWDIDRYHMSTWLSHRLMHTFEPSILLKNVKARFLDEVYTEAGMKGENIFRTKTFKHGDKLPTIGWGSKLLVDGQERKRIA